MIPVLGDVIADLLDDASPAEDAASDAEVNAFVGKHIHQLRPDILAGLVKALSNHFASGASRHQSTVTVLVGAMKEARAGYFSAKDAVDTIRPMFLVEVGKAPVSRKQNAARTGKTAESEFAGILSWAIGQANAADLAEVRARVEKEMPDNHAWMLNIGSVNGSQPKPKPKVDRSGFWELSDELRTIRDFAHSRRVNPWAVLGVVMARIVATIPPTAQNYPYIGRRASLNLFVGLVGPSGKGKGAAEGAGFEAAEMNDAYVTGPGSGEGINHLFARHEKKVGTVFHRRQVFFSVNEVDTLASLSSRSGATLLSQLCKAWSGESLTFAYVDQIKALEIPAHSYRLCMVVGIQPGRAGALLDATDAGVPQRFLWLPTRDPDMPDLRPTPPAPLDCREVSKYWPPIGKPARILELPPAAAYIIDRNTVLSNRGAKGTDVTLDGHLGLCRIKVAIALMLLHGETKDPTQEHWEMSGVVMAVSQETRDSVEAELAARAVKENLFRGKLDGVRSVAAASVQTDEAIKRIAKAIVRYLSRHGQTSKGTVRKGAVSAPDRGHFEDALERLIASGQVEIVSGASGDELKLVTP